MKALRFVSLSIGWLLLGLSVVIFTAACGLGWAGEQVMKLAFNEQD